MKNFEMLLPSTLEEAKRALPAEAPEPLNEQDVRILAGGQDLLTELKDHLASPSQVVNIKRVGELSRDVASGATTEIGALATVAALAAHDGVRSEHALLAEAAESIASPQVRSQATVGGNLCQRPRCWYYRNEHTVCLKKGGDECFSYAGMNKYNAILGGGPSYIVHPSDLATAFVAAEATIVTDQREIAAGDFFLLPANADPSRENVLAGNEIIERITLGAGASSGWRSTYAKVRERDGFDFAISAVALRLRFDEGRIAEARVVLGGVAPAPWRCPSTEQLLVGRSVDDALCAEAGEDALRGAEPLEHNGYKIPLTKALLAKALRHLAQE